MDSSVLHVVHAIVATHAMLLAVSQTVRHKMVSRRSLRRPEVTNPCKTQRSPRVLLKSCVSVCVCVVPE